jgi:4-amino-4-deoxy-L-arabinose transferase-like glycosyltransferase
MRRVDWAFVTCLLLLAWGLRFIGATWGNPVDLPDLPSFTPYAMLHEQTPMHPDEFFFVALPYKMTLKGELLPNFYENPSLFLLLNYATTRLTGLHPNASMDNLRTGNDRHIAPFSAYVVGRAYSALASLLTVAVVYALVRRMAEGWGALVAGGLMAFCLPFVQHAHYAITSVVAGCMVALAFWAFAHTRNGRWAFAVGAFVGLATATRYNAGVVVLAVAVLGLWRGWRAWVWAGVGGALAFTLAMPYWLLDTEKMLADVRSISSQYLDGSSNVLAPLLGLAMEWHYLLFYGIGAPSGILLAVGAWRARTTWLGRALLLYTVAYSVSVLRTVRPNGADHLLLPLLPSVVALVGLGASSVLTRLTARSRAWAVVAVWLVPLCLSVPFVREVSQWDNRIHMTRWLNAHVPSGASVLLVGAYNVALDPARYDVQQVFAPAHQVDYASLPRADYVVISDATYHVLARTDANLPPIALPEGAQLVASLPRVSKWGDTSIVHTASYWHNPALWVYAVPPALAP